jgi:hypothetical protein
MLQRGQRVIVEGKSCTGAHIDCVGVNKHGQEAGPSSGGFAIILPMPEIMWGTQAHIKVSLKRVRVQ